MESYSRPGLQDSQEPYHHDCLGFRSQKDVKDPRSRGRKFVREKGRMFLGQRLNSGAKHEWITDAHSKQRVTEAGACSIFLLVKRQRGVMQNSSAIKITPQQNARP